MKDLFKIDYFDLAHEDPETSFDIGIKNTSLLLIRFMVVMAVIVILVNGLTPEMLPMIVTTNLVKGANDRVKEETIVRNLHGFTTSEQ